LSRRLQPLGAAAAPTGYVVETVIAPLNEWGSRHLGAGNRIASSDYLCDDQYLSASACRFCCTCAAVSGCTMKLPSSSTAASAISGGVASQNRLIWLYLPSLICLTRSEIS